MMPPTPLARYHPTSPRTPRHSRKPAGQARHRAKNHNI